MLGFEYVANYLFREFILAIAIIIHKVGFDVLANIMNLHGASRTSRCNKVFTLEQTGQVARDAR